MRMTSCAGCPFVDTCLLATSVGSIIPRVPRIGACCFCGGLTLIGFRRTTACSPHHQGRPAGGQDAFWPLTRAPITDRHTCSMGLTRYADWCDASAKRNPSHSVPKLQRRAKVPATGGIFISALRGHWCDANFLFFRVTLLWLFQGST
jgi:hypothetical protein